MINCLYDMLASLSLGLHGAIQRVVSANFFRCGLLALVMVLWMHVSVCPALSDDSGVPKFIYVSMGSEHGLAIAENNTVWTWGKNNWGECGITFVPGNNSTHVINLTMIPGLDDVKAVAAGCGYSMALKNDGTVWTWGDNGHGCLGDGTNISRSDPEPVPGLRNVTAIEAGPFFAMALKDDGTVWAWGINDDGELCDGSIIKDSLRIYNPIDYNATPARIQGLSDVVAIRAGKDNGMAVKKDGTVWAWGSNNVNIVGKWGEDHNVPGLAITRPVMVEGLDNVKKAVCGDRNALALKNDGTVWMWGVIDTIMEDGSIKSYYTSTPFLVSNLTDIVDIELNGHRSIALRSDGTVYTWGYNHFAELGDGTNVTLRSVPVQIPLRDIKMISCKGIYALALSNDGVVWIWGSNEYGTIGGVPKKIYLGAYPLRLGYENNGGTGINGDPNTSMPWSASNGDPASMPRPTVVNTSKPDESGAPASTPGLTSEAAIITLMTSSLLVIRRAK